MHYHVIRGQRWFYRLNKQKFCLFNSYSKTQLLNGLIVSYILNNGHRLFTYFNNYIEFAKYQSYVPIPKRTFFEIIIGDGSQKPHFDLDFKLTDLPVEINPESVKDRLVNSIISVLTSHNINIDINRHILMYTSHGEFKQSYHIIIDGYYHTDNIEAREFYNLVVDTLPENEKKYIDHSVYSTLQNFRIVGSQKLNSGRIKHFNTEWIFKGNTIKYKYTKRPETEQHRMILNLEVSLISNVKSCSQLSPFNPKPTQHHFTTDIEGDIDEDTGRLALQLLAEVGGMPISDPRFPYQFSDIQNNLVILKRISPSNCRICNRIHENENPFLAVNPKNMKVYFHCRRADENERLYVGQIDQEDLSPVNALFEAVSPYLSGSSNDKFDLSSIIENRSSNVGKSLTTNTNSTFDLLSVINNSSGDILSTINNSSGDILSTINNTTSIPIPPITKSTSLPIPSITESTISTVSTESTVEISPSVNLRKVKIISPVIKPKQRESTIDILNRLQKTSMS